LVVVELGAIDGVIAAVKDGVIDGALEGVKVAVIGGVIDGALVAEVIPIVMYLLGHCSLLGLVRM
jgi:hypothetical protein